MGAGLRMNPNTQCNPTRFRVEPTYQTHLHWHVLCSSLSRQQACTLCRAATHSTSHTVSTTRTAHALTHWFVINDISLLSEPIASSSVNRGVSIIIIIIIILLIILSASITTDVTLWLQASTVAIQPPAQLRARHSEWQHRHRQRQHTRPHRESRAAPAAGPRRAAVPSEAPRCVRPPRAHSRSDPPPPWTGAWCRSRREATPP